ncbi:isopeptide-forming domain-containing fimbrial protein [Enterococcus crotali]
MSRKIKKWLVIFLLPTLLLTIGSKTNAEEISSRLKIPEANKIPLTISPLFKPITQGKVVSVPAEYTFQPKATAMTTVKVIDDTGDITPPRGTWKKGFAKSNMGTHPYVIATYMGLVNNKWVDVKLIPISTKNAEGFYVGLNKDNDGSIGTTARESLFTVSDTNDSEPKLTMQFIDHQTGAPIQVPGGHITYSDIDNDEWINFSSAGSEIVNAYSWSTTKLKGAIDHNTNHDLTISSEGALDVPETNKNYWVTVTYNATSSIDLQFNARQSGIAFGYHEFDELMFELSDPNKIGDTDGNIEDEAITYSIYQDVPYRSGLTALSKFAIEDSIPAALDIVSVNVFNNGGMDVTSRFTNKTIGNQVVLEGNYLMLANTAKDTYRVDIKTKLNKNENYMQYYNTSLGQLVIPNNATTKYTNSPNNESFVLNSPVAYGHIKMDIPNTPPVISLDKKKDVSTGEAYKVTGKWRDLDSQSVIIMYSVDGSPLKLGQFLENPQKGVDQPFIFEVPASELPLGNHTIKVIAADAEGLNSNIEELLLTPPNTPPIISLDKKKDVSTGEAYEVTGKWRDLDSDSVVLLYSVDGGPNKLGKFYENPQKGVDQPFTFEIPASELPLGNHTIKVIAGDAEGLMSNVEELLLEPPAVDLKISFVDENGTDIILPITQPKTVGDKIDLTADQEVLAALDEVRAKYYDLTDRPLEKFTIEATGNSVVYKFSGQLVFVSAPPKIDFGLKQTTAIAEVKAEKPEYTVPLVVLDNRANNQEWKLTVQVTDPLTSSDKTSILPDALIYKRGQDEDVLATGVTALISQQVSVKGTEFNVSKEEWEEKGNGFQFNLGKGQSRKMEEYTATILYSLGETP